MGHIKKTIVIVVVLIINAFSADAQWVQTDAAIKTVSAIAVKDSVLFAATKEGVYMSRNSGYAWTKVGVPVDGVSITISDTSVFLGTYMYILRANMDGANWRKCFYIWADIYALLAVRISAGGWWIYAGTPYSSKFAPGGGVLLSRDNGVNWVPS